MEELYIGKEFVTSSLSGLTIVKKVSYNIYECRCVCGSLLLVNANDLLTKKIRRCKKCTNKFIIRKTNSHSLMLLCYIWEKYLYLYNKPSEPFKREVIKKNIKFFPELKYDEESFLLFSNWALSNKFNYENNNVYLDRFDKNKDFNFENCFWTDKYRKDGTMLFIRKDVK